MIHKSQLKKISDSLWEIPCQAIKANRQVPARIYANETLLSEMQLDRSLEQLVNVSMLPGIQKWALAMPDMHEGYGFPIGGIAAFDLDTGIISPGGIGYDINCGVRLCKTQLTKNDIAPYLKNLGKAIMREVPCGVGQGGNFSMSKKELDEVLIKGAKRLQELGFAEKIDLQNIESGGELSQVDPSLVSDQAKARGKDQLGTLGSGNHFIELGYVQKILDEKMAKELNLFQDQITILIHTGSRGLGHQVATDYIRIMNRVMPSYNIQVLDRELACAPFSSPDGKNYFGAMKAAANFAWANRQLITFEIQKAIKNILGPSVTLSLVYDVAHNIAKIEEYEIEGKLKKMIVHRKGATRAFPNQPVLIPGSMGTASYVLIGQESSLKESFGSTCHGAGRRMSRTQARKKTNAETVYKDLSEKGIFLNASSKNNITEEAPFAYKDIDEVIKVIQNAQIAKPVAKLKPLVVIKG